MNEKITTDLLIKDIKNKKKKSIVELLLRFICIAAIIIGIVNPLETFPLINLLLPITAIFVVIALIIIYNWHTIIRQVKCNNIDIYEDEVVKKAITRGGKGTLYHLVFNNYNPHEGYGVIVSDKQYDQCELGDKCYIVYIKTNNTKPYILVYPTKNYTLSEDIADRMIK